MKPTPPHIPRRSVTTIVSAWLTGLVLLIGSLSTMANNNSQAEPNYSIYLTNKTKNDQPVLDKVTVFDCSDRVYVVVEVFNLSTEMHKLEVNWINPQGERQERTRFEFKGGAFSRSWAWLQLHGSTGAAIGQIFDPSFGMENFIGNWTAEVLINKKPIQKVQFQVLC